MQRLRIIHDTLYRYSAPVAFGEHQLCLRPREGHDVRIESMTLQIRPAFALRWYRDMFGNSVAIVEFKERAEELHIRNHVVVDRCLPFPVETPAINQVVPYPLDYNEQEAPVADAYRRCTFPADAERVGQWLREAVPFRTDGDANAYFISLNAFIKRNFRYQRREQKGVQNPAQTLDLGTGSCRDTAVLLMESARLLGVAARFASGYLHCPSSVAGRASTHAWTELYFPGLGWTGFDPTLGEVTSQKHVTLGVSQHPRGVMPITGSYTTAAGAAFLGMTVSVQTEVLPEHPDDSNAPEVGTGLPVASCSTLLGCPVPELEVVIPRAREMTEKTEAESKEALAREAGRG
ncbi:cysteine protease [Verrucomicrobia bacterium LW23]|nr:cysteine protease [Verrucomicrobia bacterium LW23]